MMSAGKVSQWLSIFDNYTQMNIFNISRWSNPDARDTVDELDWERTAATDGGRYPLTDHTTGTEGGFFMQVL